MLGSALGYGSFIHPWNDIKSYWFSLIGGRRKFGEKLDHCLTHALTTDKEVAGNLGSAFSGCFLYQNKQILHDYCPIFQFECQSLFIAVTLLGFLK